MPAIFMAVTVLGIFFLAFRYYSKYLAEHVYALDPDRVTPAHRFEDGTDFVPTNKHVLLGHHFTSVAGAAPIVGPAIAVIWGWLPALVWVVLGTVFAAGAHDFGALVVSVRNKGQNIGTLTTSVINKRARTLFLTIIFFLITLVNGVFSVIIGNLFIAYPGAVIPIFFEIPLALWIGSYIRKKGTSALALSLIGVGLLYVAILVGQEIPIEIDGLASFFGIGPRTLWILIMFGYIWIAAQLPVWMLMQPRDYINSHQLLIAIGAVFLGIIIGADKIVAPAIHNAPGGSPSWFPFLFITIACGAVSGFHCLVCSGTSSKQLDNEKDARTVGYLGVLGEGSLALCSILAVTAGVGSRALWNENYQSFDLASNMNLSYFVNGIAHFIGHLGPSESLGAIFAAVIVISFAATSLDTSVRLQRYVIQEVAEIAGRHRLNKNVMGATSVAVLLGIGMALLPGGGEKGYAFGRLWQLFGTTNQLMAGLALSVIGVWVIKQKRNPLAIVIPLVFLLTMTSWALLENLKNLIDERDWVLAPMDALIFGCALWLIVEATRAFWQTWSANKLEEQTEQQPVPSA